MWISVLIRGVYTGAIVLLFLAAMASVFMGVGRLLWADLRRQWVDIREGGAVARPAALDDRRVVFAVNGLIAHGPIELTFGCPGCRESHTVILDGAGRFAGVLPCGRSRTLQLQFTDWNQEDACAT